MHISALEENITNLKHEIQDLYVSSFYINEVLDEKASKEEKDSVTKTVIQIPITSIGIQTNIERETSEANALFGLDIQKDTDRSSKESEQLATTTDSIETASLSRTVSNVNVGSTTVPPEVLKEYAKKIDRIRETAELCIENYKVKWLNGT